MHTYLIVTDDVNTKLRRPPKSNRGPPRTTAASGMEVMTNLIRVLVASSAIALSANAALANSGKVDAEIRNEIYHEHTAIPPMSQGLMYGMTHHQAPPAVSTAPQSKAATFHKVQKYHQ